MGWKNPHTGPREEEISALRTLKSSTDFGFRFRLAFLRNVVKMVFLLKIKVYLCGTDDVLTHLRLWRNCLKRLILPIP